VDADGSLVFATADGRLGVAPLVTVGDATVELLTAPCRPALGASARGASPVPPVAGIAPLSEGAIVAACHSGTVFAVAGVANRALSNYDGKVARDMFPGHEGER